MCAGARPSFDIDAHILGGSGWFGFNALFAAMPLFVKAAGVLATGSRHSPKKTNSKGNIIIMYIYIYI